MCNQLSPALSRNITESHTVQTLGFFPPKLTQTNTNPHDRCPDCSFLPLYLPLALRPRAVTFFSKKKKKNVFSSALQSCVALLFCFPLCRSVPFRSEPKRQWRAGREKRRRRERRVELLTRCTPLPAEVNPCTASVLLHSCTGPAFHSSSLPSSTASSSSSPPFFPALPLSLTLSLFFPLPAVTHNTDLLNLHMQGQRAFKN